jgi:hypothetical protein
MSRRQFWNLAAMVLATTACGGLDTDEGSADDPGVDFAPTEDVSATAEGKADDPHVDVWARVPFGPIESAHPYAHNSRGTWSVQVPGARKIRVNFTRFETESQYDPLELLDAEDRVVARYSGRRGAFTSAQIEGDYTELSFRSDASVAGWGFRVESVQAYGLGCLADTDCGEGYTCPQARRCVQAPCFQTCEPDPDAPPPAPPTQPPAPPTQPATQPPAPPTQPPAADAPVSPWSVAGDLGRNQEVRYALALPADARNIQVRMTGTGDADLYTRFGAAPTTNTYACRPYAGDSDESCSHTQVDAGGPLHVLVRGYQASNHYALTATWTTGAPPAPPAPSAPPSGAPITELNERGTLAAGAEVRFQVQGRAGQALTVEMTGTGDADLYVRASAAPTTAQWDCRPYLDTANETCTLRPASDGPVHILVHGYSNESTYVLRTRR